MQHNLKPLHQTPINHISDTHTSRIIRPCHRSRPPHHRTRLAHHAQQLHLPNHHAHPRIIPERPIHPQHPRRPTVAKPNLARRLLHHAVSIVKVQRPRRLPGGRRRNDELERHFAQRGSGVGAVGAHRHDRAAADVHGDLREAHVRQVHGRGVAVHGRQGPEVVKGVVGEVDGDVGGVFAGDGADEDAGAEEELG